MSARTPIMPLLIFGACALTGCGQKGPLYLPDKASEIVTRPTQTAPPENSGATSSPQTVDSPAAPPSAAPESSAPEGDKDKKKQDAATPPR